jgi:hypothetical protein
MRAWISSEFRTCRLMVWCACMASMIAFINSSGRLGELANCSFVLLVA